MLCVVLHMRPKRYTRNYSITKRTYGDVCVYCGGNAGTVDHVIPWSYVCDQSRSNLVTACQTCNSIASNLVFQSFTDKRDYVRNRRIQLGYGNYSKSDITDVEDTNDLVAVIDAEWKELDEYVVTICERQFHIQCGIAVQRGYGCVLDILTCELHSVHNRTKRRGIIRFPGHRL